MVLVEEDLAASWEAARALPPGWTGDAFRIVHDAVQRRPAVEVSVPVKDHFMSLPPLALPRDFAIEVEYAVGYPFATQPHLLLTLESSTTKARLPLSVDWQGAVKIGASAYKPLAGRENAYHTVPVLLRVVREGKKLSVFLKNELVVSPDLKSPDETAEFDTLRIGLPGEYGNGKFLARLYSLKVTTPAE
jgi:hypothetical protein